MSTATVVNFYIKESIRKMGYSFTFGKSSSIKIYNVCFTVVNPAVMLLYFKIVLKLYFLCASQGLLSVTEELHSLSFEAFFIVQGLTIDLEVWLVLIFFCCSNCRDNLMFFFQSFPLSITLLIMINI